MWIREAFLNADSCGYGSATLDSGQERLRTGEIQDRRNFRTGGMKEKRDEGHERFSTQGIQERRYSVKDVFRRGTI